MAHAGAHACPHAHVHARAGRRLHELSEEDRASVVETLDELDPTRLALFAYLGVEPAIERLGEASRGRGAFPVWVRGLARFGRWPLVRTAWLLGRLATEAAHELSPGLDRGTEAALALLHEATLVPPPAGHEAALASELARIEGPWRALDAEVLSLAGRVLALGPAGASGGDQRRIARHCQLGVAYWGLRTALARGDAAAGRLLARQAHLASCLDTLAHELAALEDLVAKDLIAGTLFPAELLRPGAEPTVYGVPWASLC